jgi:hypothetical protein
VEEDRTPYLKNCGVHIAENPYMGGYWEQLLWLKASPAGVLVQQKEFTQKHLVLEGLPHWKRTLRCSEWEEAFSHKTEFLEHQCVHNGERP